MKVTQKSATECRKMGYNLNYICNEPCLFISVNNQLIFWVMQPDDVLICARVENESEKYLRFSNVAFV